MYKILLVDDEKLELEAIAQYVRWEDMGIAVADTAKNGREALQKMSQCKPDIILTDVRMPVMDGLEFARKAKQVDKHVKLVFLSGHDEFQYIKAALSVEAVGYLLKPVDHEELAGVMQRVIRKCEEDKQLLGSAEGLKERLVRSLAFETDPDERRNWIQKIERLPRPLPLSGRYKIAYASIHAGSPGVRPAELFADIQRALERRGEHHYAWYLDEERFCAIYYLRPPAQADEADNDGETADFWKALRGEFESRGAALSVGLSGEGRHLIDLHDRFEEAKLAHASRFYDGDLAIRAYSPFESPRMPTVDLAAAAAGIGSAISHARTDEIDRQVAGFLAPYAANRTPREIIVSEAAHLLSELERQYAPLLEATEGARERQEENWKKIMEPDSLEELRAQLAAWCRTLAGMIEARDKDKNMPIVQRVMEAIDVRYSQALTVEQLAAEVYLSPNYIRTLFKEKTGETILEYLTRVRIKSAAELLKDKSLRIHEISKAVGYENVSYFCALFQKHRGVTPNDYRKKLL
ncbi:response regulator [Cohnella sp. JJ-181]|uniref:response regulator n=1 Tax=Cohnella rhizoplanae TaxID=2974897 RepID=UPI0022FFB7B9|nr:response regulator [Cohnella sp. JJ-181]CAI6079044.1 HTH-type transcriptional activator RhaR [Cohnella sp. JJ-181]